jgi:hypothetical protein
MDRVSTLIVYQPPGNKPEEKLKFYSDQFVDFPLGFKMKHTLDEEGNSETLIVDSKSFDILKSIYKITVK